MSSRIPKPSKDGTIFFSQPLSEANHGTSLFLWRLPRGDFSAKTKRKQKLLVSKSGRLGHHRQLISPQAASLRNSRVRMYAVASVDLLLDGTASGHLLGHPAKNVLKDGELPLGHVEEGHVLEGLDGGQVQLQPEVAPVVVGARGEALELLALAEGEVRVDALLGLLRDYANIPLCSGLLVYLAHGQREGDRYLPRQDQTGRSP